MKRIGFLYVLGLLLFFFNQTCTESLGGWAISQELIDWICKTLPKGSSILECGSGYGSGILSLYYNVYSIEHDPVWLNKYKGPHYIFAPIQNHWYHLDLLKYQLPTLSYNLILVDGPPQWIGRHGFLQNLHLFKTDNVIIVFDDIDRKPELYLMLAVAKKLNRTPRKLASDQTVGILMP